MTEEAALGSVLEETVSEAEAAMEADLTEQDSFLQLVDSAEEEVGIRSDGDAVAHAADEAEVDEEEITGEEVTGETEPEDAEPAGEEPQAFDADELERALTALRRDGLTKDLIDKMGDQEIVRLGQKRAKVQSDADNAYRELTELKKQQETAEESPPESPESEPADQPGQVDLAKAVEPFADIFGEEAAQALTQVQTAAMQTVEPRLEQMQQSVSTAMSMIEDILLTASRTDLAERFPLLSADDAYGRVRERMASLVKTWEYTDIASLMSDASRIEFSDEAAAAQADFKLKKLRQKTAGQMTPTDQASTPADSLSEDEREDALLTALESGASVDEAKRLYGSHQPLV